VVYIDKHIIVPLLKTRHPIRSALLLISFDSRFL